MSDHTFRHSALAVADFARKSGNFSGLATEFEEFVEFVERAFEVNAREARRFLPYHIPRLPWDVHFMLESAVAATRSTCDRGPELALDPGRHGVGAVFVRDRRVVAGGYNGSPPGQPHCDFLTCSNCETEYAAVDVVDAYDGASCGTCGEDALVGGHLIRGGHCVRTLHAEENALLQCAMDGTSPRGVTVYTTASPCWDCAKRLVRVGVARVVFGAAYDSRYGLSGDAKELLVDAGIAVERLDLREHLRLGGGE